MAFAMVLAALKSGSEIEVAVDQNDCGRSGVSHLVNKIKVTRIRAKQQRVFQKLSFYIGSTMPALCLYGVLFNIFRLRLAVS